MKRFKKEQPIICFFFEKVSRSFSSFNPFPSLPSVATNDRKQNKRYDIVLNSKPRPLFLEIS